MCFGSTGYLSRGFWFAGGGIGGQAIRRVAVSAAFSRAWSTDAEEAIVRERNEIAGSAAFSLRPQLLVFGSVPAWSFC